MFQDSNENNIQEAMLTKKLNGCKLEMYDSIEVAPIENYINFNRLIMLDSGIGSDLNAVMNHWANIQRFCEKGEVENLSKQLANYRQALTFIMSNISPRMLSFVTMIHKIDGKVVEDFSDENMAEILKQLSKKGLTVQIVEQFLEFVKKKLTPNLKPTNLEV